MLWECRIVRPTGFRLFERSRVALSTFRRPRLLPLRPTLREVVARRIHGCRALTSSGPSDFSIPASCARNVLEVL